jgi:hypothetical protein
MEKSDKSSINARELEEISVFEARRYRHENGSYLWNFVEFFEEFTPEI